MQSAIEIPNELIIQIAVYINNYEDLLQLFNLENQSSYLFLISLKYPKYTHKNLYKHDAKSIYKGLTLLHANYNKGKLNLNNYKWAETSYSRTNGVYPLVKYMMLEGFCDVNAKTIIFNDDVTTFYQFKKSISIANCYEYIFKYNAVRILEYLIYKDTVNNNIKMLGDTLWIHRSSMNQAMVRILDKHKLLSLGDQLYLFVRSQYIEVKQYTALMLPDSNNGNIDEIKVRSIYNFLSDTIFYEDNTISFSDFKTLWDKYNSLLSVEQVVGIYNTLLQESISFSCNKARIILLITSDPRVKEWYESPMVR